MALFRFGQNWDPFSDLEREVDRLLRSVNMTFHGIRLGRQYPAVNLYELENEYVLTAELPGTRPEDLDLTLAGGILTLKGRRDDSRDVPEHRFRRSERFRGEAIAQMTSTERAGGTVLWHCASCNYQVRPQVALEIRVRGALVQCDGCRRYLVADESA